MGKLLQHPVADLSSGIPAFNESGNFSHFMDLLILAVRYKIDVTALARSWEENRERIEDGDFLKEFSRILPVLEITYKKRPPRQTLEDIIGPDKSDLQEELTRCASEFCEALAQQEEAKKKLEFRYSWFEPAWEICTYLLEYFPDDEDPGKKLGEYLNLLYTTHSPRKTESLTLLHGSPVYRLVEKVGFWALEKRGYPEPFISAIRLALEILLHPRKELTSSEDKLSKIIFPSLQFLPSDFFHTWFREWLQEDPSSEGIPEMDDADFKVLFKTLPVFQPSIRRSSKSALAAVNADEKGARAILEIWKNPEKIPFISPEIVADLYHRADCSSIRCDEEIEKITLGWMPKFTELRRSNGGVSPLDQFASRNVQIFLERSNVPWENIDFSFIPAIADSDSDFGVYTYSSESLEADVMEGIDKDDRQSAYLCFYRMALDEGYFEMAYAILAFFVFSQAIAHRGQLGDLSVLMPVFKDALEMPGNQMLKRSLALVVFWCEECFPKEAGNLLQAKNLRSLLPSSIEMYTPKEEMAAVDAVRLRSRIDPGEVEEDLKYSILGEKRWGILHDDSRQFLARAELNWRLQHAYLESGITDWGSLVLDYCKVFEKEMAHRYEQVIRSEGYRTFKIDRGEKVPDKLTGGYVIKDLRGFKKHPENIQLLIEGCGLGLYKNRKLLNEINDMFFKFRNKAAHTEILDSFDFVSFRKTLFQEKLLSRFLDSLDPVES